MLRGAARGVRRPNGNRNAVGVQGFEANHEFPSRPGGNEGGGGQGVTVENCIDGGIVIVVVPKAGHPRWIGWIEIGERRENRRKER